MVVLFIFTEYVRVVLESPLKRSADNILFCTIAIMWAVFLKRRILEKRNQRILISIAFSLVLLYVVRTCRYILFSEGNLLWYMYYFPLTSIPLFAYFMSKIEIGKPQKEKYISDRICMTGLVLINLMVLTNNYHQFVFKLINPDDNDDYTRGFGFYILVIWMVGFTLVALYNLYRKCSLPQSRSKMWIPVTILAVGLFLILLSVFNLVPKIKDTDIYLFQDIILMTVIFLVEACIYIGIIPSNDGYEEIFTNSLINACITDENNNVIYSSNDEILVKNDIFGTDNLTTMLDENTRLHSKKIDGGTVYFTESIKEIVNLNNRLEEAAEVISDENAMIEAENQLLRDETMYKTKNKIYDDIARIVKPQVLKIEEYLDFCKNEPDKFDEYISKAAVLNAYIKRRINLSLLSLEGDKTSLTELYLSMSESLNYLKYCGVDISILNDAEDTNIDVALCIDIYDFFESIIEAYLERFNSIMVTLDKRAVRILLETNEDKSLIPESKIIHTVYQDEDSMNIIISFEKEGDKK